MLRCRHDRAPHGIREGKGGLSDSSVCVRLRRARSGAGDLPVRAGSATSRAAGRGDSVSAGAYGVQVTDPSAWQMPPSGGRLLAWPRRTWRLELVSVLTFDALYELIRALVPTHITLAFADADKIMNVEARTNIDPELALNRALTAHPLLGSLFGYYYGSLFFALTPALLAWLWCSRPESYAWLRSTLVLSTFVALLGYWLFPVAPPRFAMPGATDTLAALNVFGAAHPHSITGVFNNYAAMPSLHVAWATWCATAVVVGTRGRWRHLAWLYPITTTLVVLATANHYLLDALVGAAIVGGAVRLTRGPSPGGD